MMDTIFVAGIPRARRVINSTARPHLSIELVGACPGIGFGMLGDAIRFIGRRDILTDLPNTEAIAEARRPVLAVPAGGTWNFLPTPKTRGVVGILRHAYDILGTFDNITIALDCAGEGIRFDMAINSAFASEIASYRLDKSRLFLITSRIDAASDYEAWCATYAQSPIFTPVYSPMQLYYYAGKYRETHNLATLTKIIEERSPFLSDIRPRKFVCLNFMPRDNRWAIMLHLLQEGVINEGFVSFQGRSPEVVSFEGDLSLNAVKQQLRDFRLPESLVERVDDLDRMAPIELDEPSQGRFDKAYAIADHAYYAQSYFSIVTESDFSGAAGRRFSEKVLKPIANLQPFVSLATRGTMAELRRLGFQTFAPLIDESYDEIEDPAERLHAGIEAALKLIRLSPADLHALYVELWPRLVHNYLHFLCATPALVDRDEALLALSMNR